RRYPSLERARAPLCTCDSLHVRRYPSLLNSKLFCMQHVRLHPSLERARAPLCTCASILVFCILVSSLSSGGGNVGVCGARGTG
ncbi:MAG: hypothetical protein ACK55Z_07040, partial [bacterium]